MMGKLREKYEKWTIPIGKLLSTFGITPNQITILSIFVGLLPLYYLTHRNIPLALLTFTITVLMDILDGSVARATGRVSKFGQLLDHFADRTVEFEIIIGLILGGYLPGWLGALMYFSMIMPSYVRARGESLSNISGQGVGFFERKEKILSIFIGLVAEYYFPGTFCYIAVVVIIFSLITAIQRILFFRKHLA